MPRGGHATSLRGTVTIGAVALAVQVALLYAPIPPLIAIDPVAPGMLLLALACWWRTFVAARPIAAAGRWRWQAAMTGWLLWALQWALNMVEPLWLEDDKRLLTVPILAHRVAFIVALVPIASFHDMRAFRWLDAMLGVLFASMLTLLSWPELPSAVSGDPDRRFLYLGYVAMAALAAVSMVAQRGDAIRPLPRALFATMLLYGIHGIVMRELFTAGTIDNYSPLFLLGDLAFVAYLVLMPAHPTRDAAKGAMVLATGPAVVDTIVLRQLVPLPLSGLIIVLAFVVSDVAPIVGIIIALAAFAIYAARTTLTEHLHHAEQRTRLVTMVDMMHEIRSPLAAVALNVGLLTQRATADEREQRMCAAIRTGCDNVVTLLEDVLSLERLEAGLVPPVIASHDVSAIARETAALLEPRWQTAGVAVRCPDAPFVADVDRAALHRILMNLVANAVRFTPSGGEVRVAALRAGDGSCVLEVRDTGVGMTEEARARLFQRFAVVGQPLHGTRGTGLGLSISLALAHTMNGRIEVASREGVGTTVRVTLPQSHHGSFHGMNHRRARGSPDYPQRTSTTRSCRSTVMVRRLRRKFIVAASPLLWIRSDCGLVRARNSMSFGRAIPFSTPASRYPATIPERSSGSSLRDGVRSSM